MMPEGILGQLSLFSLCSEIHAGGKEKKKIEKNKYAQPPRTLPTPSPL